MNHRICYFLLLLLALSLAGPACKKEQKKFHGTYRLTGPCTFISDGYGQYHEEPGNDTAIFRVEGGGEGHDLRFSNAVVAERSGYGYVINLRVQDGAPVWADLDGNNFTIPNQTPWDGSSLSIEGSGSFGEDGTMKLTYRTEYRGGHKKATVTGKRE